MFLRLLALVYLAAFGSFGLQAEGLVGSQGILPLQQDLQAISEQHGARGYWLYPSLFWLSSGDAALQFVSLAGVGAALLLFGNILTRLMLPLLFVLYLSVVYAGQVFLNFQWDFMLLEAGFLAIFLAWDGERSALVRQVREGGVGCRTIVISGGQDLGGATPSDWVSAVPLEDVRAACERGKGIAL